MGGVFWYIGLVISANRGQDMDEDYSDWSRKVWAKIMEKVAKAAENGKGVALTPEQVRVMFLTFDHPGD